MCQELSIGSQVTWGLPPTSPHLSRDATSMCPRVRATSATWAGKLRGHTLHRGLSGRPIPCQGPLAGSVQGGRETQGQKRQKAQDPGTRAGQRMNERRNKESKEPWGQKGLV
jgi:hypothetical protein